MNPESKINGADLAVALCEAELRASFDFACSRAGGGSWDSMKDLPFKDVMKQLAPNGVRFTYVDGEHLDEKVDFAGQIDRALPFLTP